MQKRFSSSLEIVDYLSAGHVDEACHSKCDHENWSMYLLVCKCQRSSALCSQNNLLNCNKSLVKFKWWKVCKIKAERFICLNS